MTKACQLTIWLALTAIFPFFQYAIAEPILEVIVTGLRLPEAIYQAQGSWSVTDSKTLKTINAEHIQQALTRMPGVNIQRNNGQEYLPAIRSPALTGAGACGSFLMAEDGIPLRPAGFCNINELFESHFEVASRIEVARGPGITLYGSNAMHGVINVIDPAVPGSGQRIAFDAGGNDYQRIKGQLSNHNLAAAFSASHDGGFRHDSGADQQKLSLRWHQDLGKFTQTTGLTAINLNQETAGYAVGKNIYKHLSQARVNPNPEAFRDAQAVRLWSRFEHNAEEPGWIITPYARYSRMTFLQHFLPGTPLEDNGQESLGLQSAFYLYGENYRVTAGVDMEYVDGWLTQFQAQPTLGSDFLQETIPEGYQYDYDVTAQQLSPFIQWTFQATPETVITVGTRYEYMAYDYKNRMLAGRTREDGSDCGFGGCRYSRPPDSKDHFRNWSHTLGLQYHLTDNHLLSLTLARGFRTPQTGELYRLQRDQEVADLESEQLDSIELALRGKNANTRYDVAIYAMAKDNIIYRDSDFFTISDGKTRHIGIESSIEIKLANSLNLNVAATYAKHYQSAHQLIGNSDIKGNDVDGAPRFFGSAQLQWKLMPSLDVELDWQHMGKYYTDPENRHQYSGHDLVNLNTSYRLNDNTRLSLNVLNLLDTRYAKRADYTSFTGDRYFPGEPLSLLAGIEYQW